MQASSIEVVFTHTSDAVEAASILASLPDTIACDFETAIHYTDEEIATYKLKLTDPTISKAESILYTSRINATALDHPSHCTITHCSIATSDHEAYVFILDNPTIAETVLTFLVTTTKKQIWHNASFDFRHIQYYTNKLPLHYEDSMLLAKCLFNSVDVTKCEVGLKTLMGSDYGSWAIAPDNFHISKIYDEPVLRYAAIDACATYKLWYKLNDYSNYLIEQEIPF